ncbi:MAG: hypothetical protein NVS3B20_17880 [Polyangiales bacterium]
MQMIGLLASIVSASCVVVARRPARYEVSTPPPAPAVEPTVVCTFGFARVAGHWQWNGVQYVWVPQRCVYRPGFRWEVGGYVPCGDGYCFREGVWVNAAIVATPPPPP